MHCEEPQEFSVPLPREQPRITSARRFRMEQNAPQLLDVLGRREIVVGITLAVGHVCRTSVPCTNRSLVCSVGKRTVSSVRVDNKYARGVIATASRRSKSLHVSDVIRIPLCRHGTKAQGMEPCIRRFTGDSVTLTFGLLESFRSAVSAQRIGLRGRRDRTSRFAECFFQAVGFAQVSTGLFVRRIRDVT